MFRGKLLGPLRQLLNSPPILCRPPSLARPDVTARVDLVSMPRLTVLLLRHGTFKPLEVGAVAGIGRLNHVAVAFLL
jgi:hypothetical protein